MARCPACGTETPDDATECARCHLSRSLFDSVREAAGVPDADPKYLQAIGEILTAVDASAEPAAEETAPAAMLSNAARFPSASAIGRSATAGATGPRAPAGLPALPPAGDVPVLLRQVNDYLQLARRQGLDLADFGERAREGVLTQDRESLELLSRDLFVHLAASLTEQYEGAAGRRQELAGLIETASPDVELESCRAALALGDLAGAQRRLRHLDEELSELEDQWATVQILVAECDLLASTVRELGGDPEPALGPLFMRELTRVKEAMLRDRAAGRDVGPGVVYLRQLAADLRHRNFAAAIAVYRQLRALVGAPEPPTGAPIPAAG